MTDRFTEHLVPRAGAALYAREYPGDGPAIILMHGFPDNLHLYDALVPHLAAAGRRVITFDFLGWGRSDQPDGHRYDHHSLTDDLDAVIRHLRLQSVVLVAHDASGPPAIDWSLDHPASVAGLVLLNTYYHAMPALRAPEAIFGFSRPFGVGRLFQRLMERGDLYQRLYWYQVGHFMRDRAAREHYVPLLYRQMNGRAATSSRKAFYALNDDLVWTNIDRLRRVPELRQFNRPVRIVFGTGDQYLQYLNEGVARAFHALFPQSELLLLPEGRHFVQIDEPAQVAAAILTMPPAQPATPTPVPAGCYQRGGAGLRYRLMYLAFGLMNIALAVPVLADRWLLYRRVQRIFQADNARPAPGTVGTP
jgi:pimeloyl-ACP methyl ester carboxylesterase